MKSALIGSLLALTAFAQTDEVTTTDAGTTDSGIVDNNAQVISANVTQLELNWDWTQLETLLGEYCDSQLVGSVGNATIPSDYVEYLDLLNFPFAEQIDLAVGNMTDWDVPTMKYWIRQYVNYHNSVVNYTRSIEGDSGSGVVGEGSGAEDTTGEGSDSGATAGGEDATNTDDTSGQETGGDEEPMLGQVGASQFDQLLDFNEIWGADFDSMSKDTLIPIFTMTPILSETYAYYELFYGNSGVVRRNLTITEANEEVDAENQGTASEETTGEGEQPAEGSEGGFLQEEGNNEGTTDAAAGDATTEDDSTEEPGTTGGEDIIVPPPVDPAVAAFMDIDGMIKEVADYFRTFGESSEVGSENMQLMALEDIKFWIAQNVQAEIDRVKAEMSSQGGETSTEGETSGETTNPVEGTGADAQDGNQ